MCGAVNHSIGYRETNWLIASQLLELFTNDQNRNLMKMYWTGLIIKNEVTIGVESEDATESTLTSVADFTSIYNPLWAKGQPSEDLPTNELVRSCIALDLRNNSNFGWRVLPCSHQLPILCQNYACLPGTFRCVDNSKCIPASFQNDGFKDCLDGSDESESRISPRTSSSTPNSLLSSILRENPVYEWPMIVSSGGVLSPTTVKYGRGECTHRWTVLSPNDQHFVIWIKWMTPTTSTTIFVEGKNSNGRIYMNSKNSTSSFTFLSSSFVLTASDTDTRKVEFQIHFQEADNSLCKISENNQLIFDSETIPMPCHYHFSTQFPSSYIAFLIRKCEGKSPFMSTIRFNNSTLSLAPSAFKKLLVIPSNSLNIDVESTWPGSETKLDIQFFELTPGAESVDLFLIDSNFEIEWIPKSSDICMEGQFRTLTVNMILTSYNEDSDNRIDETATWETKNFRKSCNEDNVQIVSTNRTTYVADSGTITGFGPTTVVIHQSAEPFHFHSIYGIHQRITEAPDRLLDSISVGFPTVTSTPSGMTTTTSSGIGERCKLPIVVNGYIKNVSYNSISFSYGTVVEIDCAQGYLLNPQPYPITCDENGFWKDQFSKIYEGDLPTVECYNTECPSETYIESQLYLDPDNNDTYYGAIREYKTLPPGTQVVPFCICGDVAPHYNQWMCYNYEYLSSISDACILPQGDNVRFFTQDLSYKTIFPTGYTIRMECELCPFVEKYFTCQNGLWKNSEGEVQKYGSFQCDCYTENDPCKPHGKFVEYSGFYGCLCDKGYKFKNNTCEDINECEEKSDYCDPGLAACVNTQGGFTCKCTDNNYHIYNSTTDNRSQWGSNIAYWIDGYSCIETTCEYKRNWPGLNVIEPPNVAQYYKSGKSSGYSYVTNLCTVGAYECVLQFQQSCNFGMMLPEPDPTRACSALDGSIYHFSAGIPSFHIFQEIDVSCKINSQILIGRPKVFCNGNLQWEIMPRCVYLRCSDLYSLVKWPLKIQSISSPLENQFVVAAVVTFECDGDGYILSRRTIECESNFYDPEWSSDLPTCISITSTVYPNPTLSASTSSFSSSTPSTTPYIFPWATTQTTRISPGTTVSQHAPVFHDDVVIEGSMIIEEKNILEQRELWAQTGDWIWTPSGCILHQWTFPISFLVTSIPIHIDSDQIELLIDVSQCNSSVQIGVTSSADGFIPPISDFRTVMNITSSGSFVVKLRNLKPFLALSITANGYVQICGVTIRENMCNEVDYNGLHLESSKPFSMRRYLPATCTSNQIIAPIRGYCDSRRGWVIQSKPCFCNPNPPCANNIPIQRDQTGLCTSKSCANGACQQYDGYYDCVCNEFFIRSNNTGQPYCAPDHCSLTSRNHNSGYNCETGEDDVSKECDDRNFKGNFCQFEGEIVTADRYIYMLRNGAQSAVATDVCESADTEYAIVGVNCSGEDPPTTTSADECSSCYGQCVRDTPYYGGVSCYCSDNDYGRECRASKRCFDTNDVYICQNGGTCHLDGVKTYCNCTSNFDGEYCQIAKSEDQCNGQIDCVNGYCRQENGEMYCNCIEGYIWDSKGNCTVYWDMCSLNNPCQQNGNCSFNGTSGEITCDCSEWGGKHCELQPKKDNCTVCENSEKCFDVFTSNVRCKCSPGFSGDHCTERIDDCQFEPCFNGGTCNILNYNISNGDLIESYNCTCPTGYSGTNCENRMAPDCTEMITCQNGGTCDLDPFGRAFCKCTDQFYGTYCENSCSDQCAHSYGCINNGSLYCECYSGFSAPLCNVVDDVCKANILVCQNSGTCNSKTQKCDCTDLYNGTYCENSLDKCETESVICENGGTCITETGSCECPPNYTGSFCENQIHSCSDITCFNGGTCIPYNATCKCLPGTTGDRCQDLGQPCIIYNPDGSTSPYCLNGGHCLNLPNGAACDCNGTDFTGRRCETRANINFNLVFNGLVYAPDIVSKGFANVSIAQFTICSFVQYNQPTIENSTSRIQDVSLKPHPPWLTMRGYGNSQQIVFDNNGFFICDPDKKCSREEISKDTSYKPTPITANTWHHFCLVSPSNLTSPNYTVYLDGALVQYQFAPNFNPGNNGYLQLAPSNLSSTRFEGMISMTQLYIIRLNETQIGKLAFDCFATLSDTSSEIANNTLISWNGGFTRVASSNPGVFIDPPGICSSVKCMFGRQPKANNYNSTGSCEKDRIAPTVLRCPSSKYQTTTEDFTKVKWLDNEVSFFDNIGVVRIVVNYHNGQQFGVGVTAVRYIAFDEAANSAECTFDVIVVQKDCPPRKSTFVEGGTIQFENPAAPYTKTVAKVKCNANLYPVEGRPRFYVCDIMGDYKYGDWEDGSKTKYYLPACGKTLPASQEINGTVVGSGTCQQVYIKLRDVIWSSANCDESKSCSITILPPCNTTASGFWNSRDTEADSIALQYTLSTKNALETISTAVLTHLQTNFSLVRQDSSVECDPSFPIHDTNGNVTICVSCPEGTYANTTTNQCLDCPKNTYRNSINSDQLSCTSCPEGTITGDIAGAFDESQCYRNCDEGHFESKGSCLECPEGTFADTGGLRKCICCGFDTSTFGTGKTSNADCTKTCESGQELIRSESEMAPYCQNCEKGFYKESNRGACIQCPRGLTTTSVASKSRDECNVLNCIDENTMRNSNVTIGPNTTYSELCIACEQGTFQNVPNSDHCLPCSDLSDDVTDVPITCQSTCSTEIPTEGCNCQRQIGNNSMIIMNCLPEVNPVHTNSNAIKIVLPVVFGVLLIIIVVVLFCFRKQIIAWFRKTETNDNQHVAASHWEQPTLSIPRPDLKILTSREEMDRLPPLPPSSSPSFHVSQFRSVGFMDEIASHSGMRHLGPGLSTMPQLASSNDIFFEANGSPKIPNSAVERKDTSSDDSSLGSFF